jgi:two-component system phosphate regulon sensor histidine kinase PhoR
VLYLAAARRRFASRLTDFVNNLAHEFKTPLSTIALAGDAMADAAGRADAAGVAKLRRVVADECRRLRIQVERVLEVAAFERRERAGLVLAPVDLHDVVRTAIDHFEPRVAVRHGRIDASLNADRHHVVGDEVRLLGVLHNLLDNALKYTPKAPMIRIATASSAGRVRLVVEDNGTGIQAGEERRIFEPFYRSPQGAARHEPGFGIGLSYVARVVAAHGGSVAARNAPAGGAIVEMALPVGSPPSEEPRIHDGAS